MGFWIVGAFHPIKFVTTSRHMRWSYGEPNSKYPDSKHIKLTFVDYPCNSLNIFSADLPKYLNSLHNETVTVTFKVTMRSGKTVAFQEVKIGDLQHWSSQWGYYRQELQEGESCRSPFP